VFKIGFSAETLYHFNCGKCKGWWTIGDWKKDTKLYCPHCGEHQIVEAIGGGESDLHQSGG
jgi:hypothetical protein